MTNIDWVAQEAKQKPGLWYVGSPYSSYPDGMQRAFEDVAKIAGALFKMGVPVFCPITHGHPLSQYGDVEPGDHDLWMPLDALFMNACVGLIVARMPLWHQSKGLRMEMEAFQAAGKPILLLTP